MKRGRRLLPSRSLAHAFAVMLLAACSSPVDRVPTIYDEAPLTNVHAGSTAAAHVLVVHRAEKICQLIGDVDLANHEAVQNATNARFGVGGTDLGISVRRGDNLFFLFGDTWSGGTIVRPEGSDAFGAVDARLPLEGACEGLAFPTQVDGGFDPMTLDGATLPTFNVATGAYATDRSLYAFFTIADASGLTIGDGGGRGVLARSDGDQHFTTVRAMSSSSERFNMVSATLADGHLMPSLPGTFRERDVVLMFGTGAYRESYPYLAISQKNHPDEPWIYFGGFSPAHTPVWTNVEESAMPLFPNDTMQACLGEMSVAFSPDLDRWLMLYNCRGKIFMRTAGAPWGAWSSPKTIFSRSSDGYGLFVHHPCGKDSFRCGDDAFSPARDGHFGPNESGDVYGPYFVPDYFWQDTLDREHVIFTMSTWNPYVTVLMEAIVEKT